MKLSFLITTHNDLPSTHQLDTLAEIPDTEVVILDDYSTDEFTLSELERLSKQPNVTVHKHKLNGDFASHKNYGSRLCSGEYIFQLDADEQLDEGTLSLLKGMPSQRLTFTLAYFPRLNIIEGEITSDDLNKYGWKVTKCNGVNVINYPDYQGRLYKNYPSVLWVGKLHERIASKTAAVVDNFHIIHRKTIERQRKQNEFYNSNWTVAENMGIKS